MTTTQDLIEWLSRTGGCDESTCHEAAACLKEQEARITELHDNGTRLLEAADGWKSEAERLRGIERALKDAEAERYAVFARNAEHEQFRSQHRDCDAIALERDALIHDNARYVQINADLATECDALWQDAERYRWLRTFKRSNLFVVYSNDYDGDTMMFDQTLDDAIDAARAKLEEACPT